MATADLMLDGDSGCDDISSIDVNFQRSLEDFFNGESLPCCPRVFRKSEITIFPKKKPVHFFPVGPATFGAVARWLRPLTAATAPCLTVRIEPFNSLPCRQWCVNARVHTNAKLVLSSPCPFPDIRFAAPLRPSVSLALFQNFDLLNPDSKNEATKHKLKRLVQAPNSYFMDVKCPGCFQMYALTPAAGRMYFLHFGVPKRNGLPALVLCCDRSAMRLDKDNVANDFN